jgi:hypothetical protein
VLSEATTTVHRKWIRRAMAEGRTVYDIGIDEGREGGRSPFYEMEREETRDHPNRVPFWWPPSRPPGGG